MLKKIRIEGFTSIRSAGGGAGAAERAGWCQRCRKRQLRAGIRTTGAIVDGGAETCFVGLNGGAAALLTDGDTASRIRLELDAHPNSYEAVLVPAANDELIFESEFAYFQGDGHPRPYNRLLGRGHRESLLVGSAERPQGGIASHVIELLKGCLVYHFHDTSADAPVKRRIRPPTTSPYGRTPANIAAFLHHLHKQSDTTEQAVSTNHRRDPAGCAFFQRLSCCSQKQRRIRYGGGRRAWTQSCRPNQMSDGTLRSSALPRCYCSRRCRNSWYWTNPNSACTLSLSFSSLAYSCRLPPAVRS